MKHKFLFLVAALLSAMTAWAQFNVDGLRYTVLNEDSKTVELTGCIGYSSLDLVIPATVNGYSVTSIGYNVFWGCDDLTSIKIPSSVTSIGSRAFYECHGLTSIEIPSSVKSIGIEAFWNCHGLKSLEIPNSVTEISWGAFSGCSGLTSFKIPNSVQEIGPKTFYYCSSLTSFKIPNSVISIGEYAFRECLNLTSIEIPSSVRSIGDYAFISCSEVTDIYCYANPEVLTWGSTYNAFKLQKATLCHVEANKLAAYQEKFGDVNVTFVGDLEPDAIESIAATDTSDGAWHTLSGVKLEGEPSEKGIYIHQGKKVSVK